MNSDLARYSTDLVAFTDRFVHRTELNQPFRLVPFHREILRLAFSFDSHGRLPWETIILSMRKKSAKTFLNALIVLWWSYTQESYTQEPPNECPIIANDLEQARARCFRTLAGLIRNNPELNASAEIQSQQIILTNGTTIPALSSDYGSNSGSNHGITSWDELWAYTSERSRRLWDELVPVPTRKNSIRIVTTYAGFENESTLLRELYLQSVGTDEHPDGKGERIHLTLPIYVNREAGIFCLWDHEPRMEWQTPQYYAKQQAAMRPTAYQRIHLNQWTVSESNFVTPELWDGNVDPNHHPLLPTKDIKVGVGVDAGIKNDNAAVVAVCRVENRLVLVKHRLWRPSSSEPLNLEETIEAFLRELHEQFHVSKIYVDPYQMHRSITTLQAAGLRIAEFAQTGASTTRMGEVLFDLLNGKNLVLYPSDELRGQALNTVAIETTRGWRIAKERASKKIDAIVALAMACCAVLDTPFGRGLVFSGGTPYDELDEAAHYEEKVKQSRESVEASCFANGYWWPR